VDDTVNGVRDSLIEDADDSKVGPDESYALAHGAKVEKHSSGRILEINRHDMMTGSRHLAHNVRGDEAGCAGHEHLHLR
jgi:hypothetical protein